MLLRSKYPWQERKMDKEFTKSDFAKKAGNFVEEILDLGIKAGKDGIEYLQSINQMVIMHLDPETLALLDKIVDAGIAKNRRDAIEKFMKYGLEFRKDIIDKINVTEEEIEHLKQQIQNMSGETAHS
jgi:hypothetical protein